MTCFALADCDQRVKKAGTRCAGLCHASCSGGDQTARDLRLISALA